MAGDDGEERTHEPTGHRRSEFRKRGDVPRSREVTSAAGLALSTLALAIGLPGLGRALMEVFSTITLAGTDVDLSRGTFLGLAWFVLYRLAVALAVPFAILWVGALLVGYAQSQGTFTEDVVKFKWDTLDVVANFQQKFLSSTPFVELIKAVVKLTLVGLVVGLTIRDLVDSIPALCGTDVGSLLAAWEKAIFSLLRQILPIAIIIAIADYAYTWYRHHERMMMTASEVKEEHRESDGDPHMKSARRTRARRIAYGKTIANVKKADLVVTNPTHYAVAIRYRPSEASAPIVVAKGVDLLAEKIKTEARHHDIPSVENRVLARALYEQCKEGQMIPEKLYGPVARVLAVILRRREAHARAQGGAGRTRKIQVERLGIRKKVQRALRPRAPTR